MKPKTNGNRYVRVEDGKICLTDAGEAWLRKHYCNTKNDDCKERFEISLATLNRFARLLGLAKTRQFMKKTQAMGAAAASKQWHSQTREERDARVAKMLENLADGKGRFQKGVTNLQRLGKKREAERIAKATATRAETRKKDHARYVFGMERKTKFHFQPMGITSQRLRQIQTTRSYMKSKYGYASERFKLCVHITPDTTRCERMERRLIALGGTVIDDATGKLVN